jgi:hypothetical protein
VHSTSDGWETRRTSLLTRKISDLGLSIRGSLVERLAEQLYVELAAKGLVFKPPVYLSDQWGCPDGTPLIGVPFYLADERLERIEREYAGAVEGDEEAMRYLRHEAGHAISYAFHLYERPDFGALFGNYSRPYHERYAANPLSRAYVRHILGWYAQKHPDEDFAETFAVWLTPTSDWRTDYAGWDAIRKLEWMDRVMGEVASLSPDVPEPTEDDLPVSAMLWTVGEHYTGDDDDAFPLGDARQFDGDLLRVFARSSDAPQGDPAEEPNERSICGLGNKKDAMGKEAISQGRVKPFEGSVRWVQQLRRAGFKLGVVSSSRNAGPVLRAATMDDLFTVRLDDVNGGERGGPDILGEAHPHGNRIVTIDPSSSNRSTNPSESKGPAGGRLRTSLTWSGAPAVRV